MANIKGRVTKMSSKKALDFIVEGFSRYDMNDNQSDTLKECIKILNVEVTEGSKRSKELLKYINKVKMLTKKVNAQYDSHSELAELREKVDRNSKLLKYAMSKMTKEQVVEMVVL